VSEQREVVAVRGFATSARHGANCRRLRVPRPCLSAFRQARHPSVR